jgi:hypothetical protein
MSRVESIRVKLTSGTKTRARGSGTSAWRANMENYIWLVGIAGGTLALEVALAFGVLRKGLTDRQKDAQAEKAGDFL